MKLKQRIYEDYLKPSRLPEYKAVLECFKNAGYKMVGILDLYNMVAKGGVNGKIFVNRHDIDTSPKVARAMFEIEKSVYGQNGSATYYFRDSTIDKKLIADIEEYGYETGYHYEELATYEKTHKLRNIEKMRDALPECRKMIVEDIKRFRENNGSRSITVASHGDFINSRYKIQNFEIFADENTRKLTGIVVEAYDNAIMQYVKARYADQILLEDFFENVKKGISDGVEVIMTLTHPRNWKVDILANTLDNLGRAWQGLKYKI